MTKAGAVTFSMKQDRFKQKALFNKQETAGWTRRVLKKLTEYPTRLTSWGQATDVKDGLETGNSSRRDEGNTGTQNCTN